MKACLPVRAFAWKEVSTETLPDSCPDPLLFLLFSRRFPALSLLLGLLRLHQIEHLLFRVDPKLGIENAAHASTRAARTACLATTTRALPSALPLAPACTRATSSTSFWAKPRNFAFCDTPLYPPYKKRPTLRLVFSSLHANGPCAFSSATNSQRHARFRYAGQPRGRAWRAGGAHAHRPCGCRRNNQSPTPGRAAPRASKFVPDA